MTNTDRPDLGIWLRAVKQIAEGVPFGAIITNVGDHIFDHARHLTECARVGQHPCQRMKPVGIQPGGDHDQLRFKSADHGQSQQLHQVHVPMSVRRKPWQLLPSLGAPYEGPQRPSR